MCDKNYEQLQNIPGGELEDIVPDDEFEKENPLNKELNEYIRDQNEESENESMNYEEGLSEEEIAKKVNTSPSRSYDLTGALADTIKSATIPTRQENIDLALKAQKGDGKALEELMIRNGRLVLKQIKQYSSLNYGFQEDLLQEGLLGIQRAVQTYDATMGCSFSTYAVPWIRQYMARYVYNTYETIRIPVHAMEEMNRIKRKIKENEQENISMTDEELAESLNMSMEKLSSHLRNMQKTKSLDEEIKVGDTKDSEVTLLEAVPAKENVELEAENTFANDMLMKIMDECLSEREKDIIRKRFGFHDGAIWTLDQIAAGYGVTRERIRQIEAKALRKLKSPRRKRELMGFV